MAEKTHIPLPSAQQIDFAALLFRVARERDRAAFAEIFDHFAPRVKSFMMRKGASAELAEDLVQETMIAVWSKAALYVPERGAASTWVFTIARNLRIDRLRRESAAHFTDLEDFDAPSDDVPGDEAMNRSQEDGHVARALAQIPPEQRELLILSYVDDVPQSMIAERLNLPLGTVKSRMRLAYRRLRKLLEAVN
ncbi:MAG: sigma-70 family RNA polymerase sigma factor [Hyphomicrobiales bacterium]|nr:sigma-70 family RNA polymerase sigma factor [Hyphomicrobiales bacterium]